jgi:DNA invertase Pin-like site-specific DNA recombinase
LFKYDLKPEEILIYLRKSRADEPTLSVEEVLAKHEARLDEWAEQNLSAPIPAENRFKEVVSGESISERTEFQRVLQLIESPDIKAVLVKELPRLGRPDTAEIGFISKIFRYTNTLVITPERIFNVTDDFEREMFESELKRGNYYLEATKKQLRGGREISVKSGNYLCSKAPYGYVKTTVMDGKRKCPTLAIDEEKANIVRNIFEWYVHENIGTQTIANRLNDLGIKSPRGKLWSADSIRTILENTHYIGEVRWNQRKSMYVVNNGVFRKTRPKTSEEELIISNGKHEAIISTELFYAAQEKRGKCHRTCDNKELRNPLASLLYCECGRAMAYRHSTRGNLKYREPRLVCNGQKYCGNGSCSVSEMVDYVAEVLRERIAYYETNVGTHEGDSTDFHEKHLRSLEKKLADINAKEISLWEAQLDKEQQMPKNVFKAITDKLVKERGEIERAIQKTKANISTPITRETQLVTLEKALSALLDPNVSVADKNQFLKACIERIEYRREKPEKLTGKGVGRQWTTPPIEVDVRLKV